MKSKKVVKVGVLSEDFPEERLSLDEMRQIWNDEEHQYSDVELRRMREFAYLFMEAVTRIVKKRKRYNIQTTTNESKESNLIYSGEYRRAS